MLTYLVRRKAELLLFACSKVPDTDIIVHSVPGMEQLAIPLYLIRILHFGCNTMVLRYGITVLKIILVLKTDSNIYSVLSLPHSEIHGTPQDTFRTMLELKHAHMRFCSNVMHKINLADDFRICTVISLEMNVPYSLLYYKSFFCYFPAILSYYS